MQLEEVDTVGRIHPRSGEASLSGRSGRSRRGSDEEIHFWQRASSSSIFISKVSSWPSIHLSNDRVSCCIGAVRVFDIYPGCESVSAMWRTSCFPLPVINLVGL